VAEALRWITDDDAKVLAGGQSLVPVLNLRMAAPTSLIDINPLTELDRIIEDSSSILIGALVRHRTLETDPLIARRIPLLSDAVGHIGHLAIRHRGTLGGSLSHADPAAELPLIAAVLGATIYLESMDRGRRAVPAEDFCTGFFTTVAEPDELLTWVRMPCLTARDRWGFVEFARRHGDFAFGGAAAVLQCDAAGRITPARVGVLATADHPTLVGTDGLHGIGHDQIAIEQWATAAAEFLSPTENPEYGRRLAATAMARAVRQALSRSEG
jgi:carbon-monoxide dehydrogenase medium subunit